MGKVSNPKKTNTDTEVAVELQAIRDPSIYQPPLLAEIETCQDESLPYLDRLASLLASDLDFRGYDTSYASHNFHSFPAKFPPQLPRHFIQGLTSPHDIVLDPMMGSGTTIVEACLLGREACGFDIDPLAELITRVKATPLEIGRVTETGYSILKAAAINVAESTTSLRSQLDQRWDVRTKAFLDYWFAEETQIELMALITQIETIPDLAIRAFFRLALSACIITKSGGVSLAFDLAHTRPHRAKRVISSSGLVILGAEYENDHSPRTEFLTKGLRSPLVEFQKRFLQNIKSLFEIKGTGTTPRLELADAQNLPLADDSVDLIVTSPPYASNAIDYMRAHKFSLVWLGYSVDDLGGAREQCIGGEATTDFIFEDLPPGTSDIVARVISLDAKKGKSLHRYYSEMTRVLREMYRVLRPGKAAVLVVASSIMRGIDTQTQVCLSEIGEAIGFQVPKTGIRTLDRDRRMMPAGSKIDLTSQIQQRMHQEFVIGFYKPTPY